MVISDWVVLNDRTVAKNNVLLPGKELLTVEELYQDQQWSYPKFFKMDKLCKWVWAGAELLCTGGNELYTGYDKNTVAVVLATSHGCIEVDKRYNDTIAVPSPALFVYTLPNIMLGELCIRHGFKGEQLCTVHDTFDVEEMHFAVSGLIKNSGMDACLCGWADAASEQHDICLFRVTKSGTGLPFTPAILKELYKWDHGKTKTG